MIDCSTLSVIVTPWASSGANHSSVRRGRNGVGVPDVEYALNFATAIVLFGSGSRSKAGVRLVGAVSRFFGHAMLCLALAGCAVPTSGPSRRDVEANATATAGGGGANAIVSYALVHINASILPYLTDPGPGSLFRTFGRGRGPVPELKVGVGDTIQVTLFEAQAGGLYIPSEAGSRPGNYIALPNQVVDSRGGISVPYAGQIRVLGRTTTDIEKEIVEKLKNRAIDPQAIVTLVSQTSMQVTVIGDINNAGKITLNPAGDRVLDVISRAGGIKNPGYEEYVTLERRGRKSTVYFLNLLKDAYENVYIEPGDTIYVYQYQRSFTAFGATRASATGVSGEFKFMQEKLTLSDAVGKANGLEDVRAEPGQVFVYRSMDRGALEKMGVDVERFDPTSREIPTIFEVNFRDPSGFFAARGFSMRDNDIIYVDNADVVAVTKFLSIIQSAVSVPTAAASVVTATK